MTHEPFRSLAEPDREHLELRVPEQPVRREPRSRWNATAWVLLGIAWIVGFVLLALLVAAVVR